MRSYPQSGTCHYPAGTVSASCWSRTNVTCYGGSDGTITITNPYRRLRHLRIQHQRRRIMAGIRYFSQHLLPEIIMSGSGMLQISHVLLFLIMHCQITQPAVLNAIVTPTMVTCNGANDGIITITSPTGGYGTYEYSINGGTTWQASGTFQRLAPEYI